MTDGAPNSLSVSLAPNQAQVTQAGGARNAFHEALTTVLSNQDKNRYQYPRELEFLRDMLSSDTVQDQIKKFIRQQAALFLSISKERKEKHIRNPDKQHKPVKYLNGELSLLLPFDNGIYANLSTNYNGRMVSIALLSIYPELDEFFSKTNTPYTVLQVMDNSSSFYVRCRNNTWLRCSRDEEKSKEQSEPGFMELQVRTRKIITPKDMAFLESQLALQQK